MREKADKLLISRKEGVETPSVFLFCSVYMVVCTIYFAFRAESSIEITGHFLPGGMENFKI